MDSDFVKMLDDNRLTPEHIQAVYEALSLPLTGTEEDALRSHRYLTSALFFAAQIPLSEDHSFLRGRLHDFLQQKTGLPVREADVLCTMLCSVLAIAFPIFQGPDETAAQNPDARFSLNPEFRPVLETYRLLAGLS